MRQISKSGKVFIISFLLGFITMASFSQDSLFTVTDIKGIVLINETDTLKIGEQISENSNITFTNKHSALELLNSKTNKFHFISPLVKPDKGEKYLTSFKKYFITPHNAMTKNDNEIKTLKKFMEYYSNPKFLVFDQNKIKVNIPKLIIDSKNFLYVNYKHQGKEINIKLKTEDGYLIISDDIFNVNNKQILPDSKTRIEHYNSLEKKSVILVQIFDPVFLNSCDCLKDIIKKADLLLSLANSKPSNIVDTLYLYILTTHGFIDKANLTMWINNKYSN